MKKQFMLILFIFSIGIVFSEEIQLRVAKYFDGTYCYINSVGEVVLKGKYIEAYEFSDGFARVKIKIDNTDRYVFIDYNNIIRIQSMPLKEYIDEKVFNYDIESDYHEGLARVHIREYDKIEDGIKYSYGYIDTNGNIVLQFYQNDIVYGSFHDFCNGMAIVETREGVGYIDKKGKWIVQPEYCMAEEFSDGMAKVLFFNTDKWGYINLKGELILKPNYVECNNFNEGMALVKDTTGAIYFINKNGDKVIDLDRLVKTKFIKEIEKYYINIDERSVFTDNICVINVGWETNLGVIEENGRGGFLLFINDKGEVIKIVNNKNYNYGLTYFKPSEGRVWMIDYGYIKNMIYCLDYNGSIAFDSSNIGLISTRSEFFSNFKFGLSQIIKNRRTSYINQSGDIIYQE